MMMNDENFPPLALKNRLDPTESSMDTEHPPATDQEKCNRMLSLEEEAIFVFDRLNFLNLTLARMNASKNRKLTGDFERIQKEAEQQEPLRSNKRPERAVVSSSPAITYSEHQSKINRQLSKEWKIPPSHHWYAAREPGSFLDLNYDRASKTAISRLASGHTKSLSFFEGRKTFKFCSKCKVQQASAEHIPDCLGVSREDLYDSPLLVIDFLRVNNLMDLV
ncbi:RNase H domain-containing protein [Trichonephila clavipes]|nr:RNase H domain-containing protein [Trichonephila clavipes]